MSLRRGGTAGISIYHSLIFCYGLSVIPFVEVVIPQFQLHAGTIIALRISPQEFPVCRYSFLALSLLLIGLRYGILRVVRRILWIVRHGISGIVVYQRLVRLNGGGIVRKVIMAISNFELCCGAEPAIRHFFGDLFIAGDSLLILLKSKMSLAYEENGLIHQICTLMLIQ